MAIRGNASGAVASHFSSMACRVSGTVYSPYELEVVAKADLHAEYFIVSPVGMMQVEQGGRTEFHELRAWMRDRTNFKLISQIPTFKLHLSRQAFSLWHKVTPQA